MIHLFTDWCSSSSPCRCERLCGVGTLQAHPRKRVLDRADYTAPARQHELDQTVQVSGYICLKDRQNLVEFDYPFEVRILAGEYFCTANMVAKVLHISAVEFQDFFAPDMPQVLHNRTRATCTSGARAGTI